MLAVVFGGPSLTVDLHVYVIVALRVYAAQVTRSHSVGVTTNATNFKHGYIVVA